MEQSGIISAGRSLPNLRAVQFRPSSPFHRTITRVRGGVASAIVALVLVGAGAYWWVDHHKNSATAQDRAAQKLFAQGEYQAAADQWEKVFELYDLALDDAGRLDTLKKISDCYIRVEQFPEAIAVLQRAQKLQPNEELLNSIAKCNRSIATIHLDKAIYYSKPGNYEKALVEANEALRFFRNGMASDSQLAEAHRVTARCCMHLEDFKVASDHLNAAIELSGRTTANVKLEKEMARAEHIARKNKLANSGKNNYIPSGKLDLSSLQKDQQPIYRSTYQPPKRGNAPNVRTTTASTSWSSSSFQHYSNYNYSQPKKAVVIKEPSYPTGRSRRPSSNHFDSYYSGSSSGGRSYRRSNSSNYFRPNKQKTEIAPQSYPTAPKRANNRRYKPSNRDAAYYNR